MALLGERVDAQKALDWGLVNYVHPDDRLAGEGEALAKHLASGPTRSYAGSKEALNRMLYPDLDGQLDLEAELQHALARSKDFVEGVEASAEVYINSTGYYALNFTIETKKFLNNELGPNTGCSGSLCWMARRDNPLFEKGLKKCVEPLQELGYVGPIDLNTISNSEGTFALEFTPRFGYDATALLTRRPAAEPRARGDHVGLRGHAVRRGPRGRV